MQQIVEQNPNPTTMSQTNNQPASSISYVTKRIRACDSCFPRKLRCDLATTNSYATCTTCVRSGKSCTINRTKSQTYRKSSDDVLRRSDIDENIKSADDT